ncbi:MAG: tRNA 2-thiouridine(34) synthase MnmA [Chloroflexi bacterium]|nr:tRNA 2-thiouridine(34) synthase MnmA [Chloroflexota bacterium]MCL5075875.1 tRNA 2-thiouridine(34) synthase MnmA [Chloroflexota bacterium]
MSGGVDSSVAAALLKEKGYEVIGITLNIWPKEETADKAGRLDACCSLAAVEDARRVADRLSIPHYVLNFREIFATKVIADFCQEYARGRTPNPCIRCNQYIKFEALLHRAKELGADFVATGHYARAERDQRQGRYLLLRGIDQKKDQSYFLYTLTQEQLAHTLLPVGELTKTRTRQLAAQFDLPVAQKMESQEICFVPDNDYGTFLLDYIPEAIEPGPILDQQGNVLGQHRGLVFYTVGQRRGIGLATAQPLYVLRLDPNRNALIVGREDELYANELVASEVNLIAQLALSEPQLVQAKIRYRTPVAEAIIRPLDLTTVHVHFKEPQRAITPGQAVVFYDGDVVIGGGAILETKEKKFLKRFRKTIDIGGYTC